jgi:hypothetical protein
MFTARSLAKIAQHVWFDVDCKDFAVRYTFGDSSAEIAGAGADVGDRTRRTAG